MKSGCRFFLFVLAFSLPQLLEAANSVALVIGNGAYDQISLRNPVNDATAIAASLERIGFDVILETDRTQRNMTEALDSFGRKLREGGSAVFYFAGHGVQVQGSNYLLPVDADLANPLGVIDDSVQVGKVLALMSQARTKLNLVILDCCRDNPMLEGGVDGSGLATQLGPPNTMIAFSTAPGSVALDGETDHSPYTNALLNHIENPKLSISEVFQSVAKDVSRETSQQQRPWKSDDLAEEYFLIKENKGTVVQGPSAGEAVVIGYSPTAGTQRNYRQKLEISGLLNNPNGIQLPLYLSISQDLNAQVINDNKLTGMKDFQVSAREVEIRIEATANGQENKFHWNSGAGPMPMLIQQYLTPAGLATVNRILASPYTLQVTQFGKINGDGLGLDQVYMDMAPGLGVTPAELKTHLIATGNANRFGPSMLFMGSEVFPGRPIQIGEKWLDIEGTELKLISAENGIFRIAATNTAIQTQTVAMNAVSGVVAIEEATGMLHRISVRGQSNLNGELTNGHFAISVEQID